MKKSIAQFVAMEDIQLDAKNEEHLNLFNGIFDIKEIKKESTAKLKENYENKLSRSVKVDETNIDGINSELNKLIKKFDDEQGPAITEENEKQESREETLKILKETKEEKYKTYKEYTNKAFKEIREKLEKRLSQSYKNEASKKSQSAIFYKSLLSEWKSQTKRGEITNKALDLELKYLRKDVKSLKLLFSSKDSIFSKAAIKNQAIRNRVYETLEAVGLKIEHAYRYPHEFSGGQRQRIVIAKALIVDPKVIIADEPIASLDISIQAQIINLIQKLVKDKGISMVFIAHDLAMVEHVADTLTILHLGRVVEEGTSKEIFKNPIHPYTKNLFEAAPSIENINEKFGETDFSNAYLNDYIQGEAPELINISKNHKVLANQEQIKR